MYYCVVIKQPHKAARNVGQGLANVWLMPASQWAAWPPGTNDYNMPGKCPATHCLGVLVDKAKNDDRPNGI